eukprot:516468-Prymnesium_polylepis.2
MPYVLPSGVERGGRGEREWARGRYQGPGHLALTSGQAQAVRGSRLGSHAEGRWDAGRAAALSPLVSRVVYGRRTAHHTHGDGGRALGLWLAGARTLEPQVRLGAERFVCVLRRLEPLCVG